VKTFQDENNEVLEKIIDMNFYENFRKETYEQTAEYLELNITATCNQKCEYCYLTKYGDNIYPVELRDEKTILRNTKMLVSYFMKHGMTPRRVDLFSGEIWGTPFSNKFFDILLNAVKSGWCIEEIMIPSNMSFILNDKKRTYVEKYIDDFKKYGVTISFSASVDGLILESKTRSFKDESKNNIRTNKDFYDKLFAWCKKYG